MRVTRRGEGDENDGRMRERKKFGSWMNEGKEWLVKWREGRKEEGKKIRRGGKGNRLAGMG